MTETKVKYVCISGHEHETRENAQACSRNPFMKSLELAVGMRFYGYCNGFFFADYYDGYKTIEAFGKDWILAREEDGYPNFANFSPYSWRDYEEDIRRWMKRPEIE